MTDTQKNKGQYFTPEQVVFEMLEKSSEYLSSSKLKVLDPCSGSGNLIKHFEKFKINLKDLTCYEIDNVYSNQTKKLLKSTNLKFNVINSDYLLDTNKGNKYDFVIANPPYVRQELINKESKESYIAYLESIFDIKINKKSNLMIYFLLKIIHELKPNGIGCVIVFDSIENSKYGQDFLKVFNKHCEVLTKYKLETPFENVLINAKVYIFKKNKEINILDPEIHKTESYYTNFKDLLNFERGIGLKSKKAFTIESSNKLSKYATEFIPNTKSINSKEDIKPSMAFIFEKNEKIPNEVITHISKRYKELHKKECKSFYHKKKTSHIIFSYFYRDKPRFYLNHNQYLVSDNFYLVRKINNLFTEFSFSDTVLVKILNSDYFINPIIENSRDLGSGLKKIQLYEINEVLVPNWNLLDINDLKKLSIELNKEIDNEKIEQTLEKFFKI
tara:strand:- start:3422 stop:4753 length:1332 start_codon:yes stop_codon:yes gene_type:complete